MQLWKVFHPNFMVVIVIAKNKKDAVELAKSTHSDWANEKLNATLLCAEVTNEFVSEKIDVM